SRNFLIVTSSFLLLLVLHLFYLFFFFFNDPATTEIYTLSLHDALPISGTAPATDLSLLSSRTRSPRRGSLRRPERRRASRADVRSEEHTSELQSQSNLVCRLLLEKKKKKKKKI